MTSTEKPILIFGAAEMAEVAHFYFTKVAGRTVSAFTVDAAFLKQTSACGLPVVAFEEIAQRFEPARHDLFVAIGYSRMNRVREEKVRAARIAGYALTSFVSPRATNYAAAIGENCFIFEDNTLQPFVRIGDNVTLWSGNHIGHHSVIEDNVFITSHVVVSGGVTVGRNSFIGVNATIGDHLAIGAFSLIGAGALILENTDEESVHVSPAKAEKRAVKSTRLRGVL